eukprot:12813964-Alexandrium_andersonii.AAC.1
MRALLDRAPLRRLVVGPRPALAAVGAGRPLGPVALHRRQWRRWGRRRSDSRARKRVRGRHTAAPHPCHDLAELAHQEFPSDQGSVDFGATFFH